MIVVYIFMIVAVLAVFGVYNYRVARQRASALVDDTKNFNKYESPRRKS